MKPIQDKMMYQLCCIAPKFDSSVEQKVLYAYLTTCSLSRVISIFFPWFFIYCFRSYIQSDCTCHCQHLLEWEKTFFYRELFITKQMIWNNCMEYIKAKTWIGEIDACKKAGCGYNINCIHMTWININKRK